MRNSCEIQEWKKSISHLVLQVGMLEGSLGHGHAEPMADLACSHSLTAPGAPRPLQDAEATGFPVWEWTSPQASFLSHQIWTCPSSQIP